MRLFICLLCLLNLTSCVYYGDIHGHAKPLSFAQTKKTIPRQIPTPSPWWERFHDPHLNQLITTALSDSPNIQTAEARVERANQLARGAFATLWPSVDFNGYAQRERFSTFGLVPPPFNGRTFNIGDLALNFNYEFDFWGKNRQTLAARVNEECAARGEYAEARLVIASAITHAYFQLLGANAQFQIAKQNATISKEIADIILSRAKHGVESDIPLKNALADKEQAILMVEQYRRTQAILRHQIAVLMGKNPFTTPFTTRSFAFHFYHVDLPAELPANLLANRPDIAAARERAEAAAHQVNVAKARFFPDINLTGLFSYQSVGLGHLFDPTSQNNAITGAFDLPIFDAGARRADLGVKYAEYDLAINDYNQTILNALREVADQLSTLQTLKSQLSAQKTAVQSIKQNYKLFSSRYNHGIVDYMQVLEIKALLLQQQMTQLDLQTRHLQAVVAMLKALGGQA